MYKNCTYPVCLSGKVNVQGTDYGYYYKSGPKYGNDEIYVSEKVTSIPTNGEISKLHMNSYDLNELQQPSSFSDTVTETKFHNRFYLCV